jgi:hypothetical protein
MGDTLGVVAEIQKISETTPNILDAKGILIATFSSIIDVREMTEWFKQNNRSFMVFVLDENTSGFNITKATIHEGLFGFIKNIDTDLMSNDFMKNLDSSLDVQTLVKPLRESLTNKLSESSIAKMGKDERDEKLNELIEFGLDKLSENDKKLLPLLTQ